MVVASGDMLSVTTGVTGSFGGKASTGPGAGWGMEGESATRLGSIAGEAIGSTMGSGSGSAVLSVRFISSGMIEGGGAG
jgi:hypothetical protein